MEQGRSHVSHPVFILSHLSHLCYSLHLGWFRTKRLAAFQQYTAISADLVAKVLSSSYMPMHEMSDVSLQIPANISFEEAASIPLGISTAAMGLYNKGGLGLGLTEPWTAEGKNKYAGKPFVIYGASTSVGQFGTDSPDLCRHVANLWPTALQLTKLSGFSPLIAVSSSSNFELLKSLGATHTIDRKLVGSLGAEVAKITSEPVEYAYDAWSSPESQQALYDLLAPRGHLALVLRKVLEEKPGKDITVLHVYGTVHVPENHQIAVGLFGSLERLLQDGSIKV
jgi:NADPH:quinone reductase-like Zn-dependent oxidoreductase